MFSDVVWYRGQSFPVIYRATRGLGLVKRLRCSSVFKQKYSFKGVGISGKFDQYFPVTTYEQPPTDFRKTCYPHVHCEPDTHTLLSLKFYRSFVNAVWEMGKRRRVPGSKNGWEPLVIKSNPLLIEECNFQLSRAVIRVKSFPCFPDFLQP